MTQPTLQQFYINEDQSIYLMSHEDAQKIKDWVQLCIDQLSLLGFFDIEFIGKGAYGFVFGGRATDGNDYVFKFSRINLPQHIQDKLEDEAWMQSQLQHEHIPKVREYTKISRQSILMMSRARGMDLEAYSVKFGRLSPRLIIKIASQLIAILQTLRDATTDGMNTPIVHGDIKPSNIVFDPESETVQLIDWGSSVYAQLDAEGQAIGYNAFGLISDDVQHTNAKLGDVYFIGNEQLNGELSSPRFDEQGVSGTLYALASGQSCRYGFDAIPATSLGLPKEFAITLQTLLAGSDQQRKQAGDYLFKNMPKMKRLVMPDIPEPDEKNLIPIWSIDGISDMETVVYSSRKSFLREGNVDHYLMNDVDNVELEKYYKNFMHGMGHTERAFLGAISRLGKYPVLGGIAVRWDESNVFIDSNLQLQDPALKAPFATAVNNVVTLAQAIHRDGIFKCCMFNAKNTQHLNRDQEQDRFIPEHGMFIPFEVSPTLLAEDKSRHHSYFEDGQDPDELLQLPTEIIEDITLLNDIRHTGLIIFEALPTHLKIHSNYVLLDPSKKDEFTAALGRIVQAIPQIKGLGVSGFMKMPYKNTRQFPLQPTVPDRFYPKDPRVLL